MSNKENHKTTEPGYCNKTCRMRNYNSKECGNIDDILDPVPVQFMYFIQNKVPWIETNWSRRQSNEHQINMVNAGKNFVNT